MAVNAARSACALVACALLAGGCGGETKTTTVVQTVQAAAPTPTTATPTTPTATTAAPEAADLPPLPEGVIGADGTYAMKTKKSDYVGENITVDEEYPQDSRWRFSTTCEGERCTIAMRRELGSGGFKPVTLQAAQGRPNVFEGQTSGQAKCLVPPLAGKTVATRQRYSLRLSNAADKGGRQTAQGVDVFLTESTNKCKLKPTRGIVSWRGSLEG